MLKTRLELINKYAGNCYLGKDAKEAKASLREHITRALKNGNLTGNSDAIDEDEFLRWAVVHPKLESIRQFNDISFPALEITAIVTTHNSTTKGYAIVVPRGTELVDAYIELNKKSESQAEIIKRLEKIACKYKKLEKEQAAISKTNSKSGRKGGLVKKDR
mgnify:CR=1 FL=1